MNTPIINREYNSLIESISNTYTNGKITALRVVNSELLLTYWQIGRNIIEFEQGGKAKATYGKGLLENLSKDLHSLHGKGFSRSNLNYMRLVYVCFPICEELPHKLSWTHVCELVKINDPLERSFYQQQAISENWSSTELIRQKKSSLYLRLASSKNKKRNFKTCTRRTTYSATNRYFKRCLCVRISKNS